MNEKTKTQDCSSKTIIELIQKSTESTDLKVWKCLKKSYFPMMEKVLRPMGLTDEEDIKEVRSMSAATLYMNILRGKFHGDSEVSTYLIGIAKNKWKKLLNQRKNSKELPPQSWFSFDNLVDPRTEEEQIMEAKNMKQRLEEIFKGKGNCAQLLMDFFLVYHADYQKMALAEKRPKDDLQTVIGRVRRRVNRCKEKIKN